MATAPLVDLGQFDLTGVGQSITVFSEAAVGGGPGQTGQVVLNNYSNYLLGVTDTSLGPLLDLQPGTANVYDPPQKGGSLVVRVKSGQPSTTNFLTAQVALAGEEIEGAWPQTLSSIAVGTSPNVPVFVAPASPAAGSDIVYTIPSGTPLRLVSFRAVFTTSSQGGRRYPYLWQVVSGDTTPTEETLLTPDSIGLSETVVVDAVPGGGPSTRSTPRRPATGTFSTTVTTLYTAPAGGWFSQGDLFLYNPGSATLTAFVQVAGVIVAAVSIGPTLSATVPIPELQAGDVLTANTSTGSVDYTLSGQENADNRRVSSFSGLLLPPGSYISTATGGLQNGDTWSGINLAFVQS